VSYRQTLYTPIVTLWAWMSQVLDSDKSLSNAVSRLLSWLATAGETVQQTPEHTAKLANAYPDSAPALLKQTADALQMEVKPEQRWCGRRVKAYDGTTVLMSTIIANRVIPNTAIKSRMWLSVSKTGGVVLCDNRAVWKLQWQRLPPVSGNWHGNYTSNQAMSL